MAGPHLTIETDPKTKQVLRDTVHDVTIVIEHRSRSNSCAASISGGAASQRMHRLGTGIRARNRQVQPIGRNCSASATRCEHRLSASVP